MTLPLMTSIDSQAPHQSRGHHWKAGQALGERLGQFGKRDTGRGKCVIADGDAITFGDYRQARGDASPCVLPRLLPQIPVQWRDAAGEALSIMPVG